MHFASDSPYLASSYRKIFGEPLRHGSRPSSAGPGPGYRSASRGSPPGPGRAGPPESLELLSGQGPTPASRHEEQLRLSARADEKEQLRGLNDRFAGYIETVRQLEQHNRLLEAELGVLRRRRAEPRRLAELFQGELRELRARLDETEAARAQAALERERLAEEVQRLRGRAEEEARGRAEAEQALCGQRREADGAALARAALERKLQALLDELAFMREAHAEQVAELGHAWPDPAPPPPEPPGAGPDLSAALKELRGQYEALAAKNLQAADEWYRAQRAHLSQQAARSHQAVRANREELGEYRRQLQARALEAESLRGANEALERQLHETEERHNAEAMGLQDTISQLENDLRETKNEMARHLREYQDLLNVKMALDIEIAAYRKLLDGEETRFSTSGISISSLNPLSNPVYSFQPRLYSSKISPTLSIKKEEKEEAKMASRISSSQVGDAFAEMIEETITSTKITEQTNLEDGN